MTIRDAVRFMDRFSDDAFRPPLEEPLPETMVRARVVLSAIRYAVFGASMAAFAAYYRLIATFETSTKTEDVTGVDGWECESRGNATGSFRASVPLHGDAACDVSFDIADVNDSRGARGCFDCTVTYAFPWAGDDDCRERLDLSRIPGTDEETDISFGSELLIGADAEDTAFRISLALPEFPWLTVACKIPVTLPDTVERALRGDGHTSKLASLLEFRAGRCFDPRGGPSLCHASSPPDGLGDLRVYFVRLWDDVAGAWVHSEKVFQAPTTITPAFLRDLGSTHTLSFGDACLEIRPPPPFQCSRVTTKGVIESLSIAFGSAGLVHGVLGHVLVRVFEWLRGRVEKGLAVQ